MGQINNTDGFMTSKEDILRAVSREKKILEKNVTGAPWDVAFEETKLSLLKRFEDRVKKRKYMILDDGWAYLVKYKSIGIVIELTHFYERYTDTDGTPFEMSDETYILDIERSELLSVEQYAVKYEVEAVTVRQWIRRGKIKTAVKFGKEWRIPELTPVPQRGYTFGQYSIKCKELNDVPEKYMYLKECTLCTIYQDRVSADKYIIQLSQKNGIKEIIMDNKEKEAFELFLIASPAVEYRSDLYGEIR